MKLIRKILSLIILTLDRLFQPKGPNRAPNAQHAIDVQTAQLKLYQFEGCPFCVKVRREIKRLGLNIEYRDILKNPAWEQEMIQGGGQRQVPCLRIEKNDGSIQWLYESSDINRYLNERFLNSDSLSGPRAV
jgi:glutaredoxin